MAETEIHLYRGACDASAAVRVGKGSLFIAASDEDSVLRVYDRNNPGPFIHSHDLSEFLGVSNPKKEEADIEGAAQIGAVVYWIGSHGRDNDGGEQETRRRLFATSVTGAGKTIKISPVGKPYTCLLRDLLDARHHERPPGVLLAAEQVVGAQIQDPGELSAPVGASHHPIPRFNLVPAPGAAAEPHACLPNEHAREHGPDSLHRIVAPVAVEVFGANHKKRVGGLTPRAGGLAMKRSSPGS